MARPGEAGSRAGRPPGRPHGGAGRAAEPLYERVRDALGASGGRFGARMAVESVNDGPLTLLIET